MVVNEVEAKDRFSSLLTLTRLKQEAVIIAKHNKPTAVLISYEAFLKMKQKDTPLIDKTTIEHLPSSVSQFTGIVSEDEIESDYKKSRAAYLQEKYL